MFDDQRRREQTATDPAFPLACPRTHLFALGLVEQRARIVDRLGRHRGVLLIDFAVHDEKCPGSAVQAVVLFEGGVEFL